jgi:DNA-binding SARP family transcriptional activator
MNSVFHATMHRLRRTVPQESVIFDRDSEIYLFERSSDYRYDVEEFERLLARTRGARPDEAEELYRQALSLCEGDYMEDSYSDWCVTRREQLRGQHLDALSDLANLLLAKGAFRESIQFFQEVLEKDPYRERAMRGIMRCLALSGEPAVAIQRYLSYAEFLELELRTSPSKETMDLWDQIRKGALRTRDPTE